MSTSIRRFGVSAVLFLLLSAGSAWAVGPSWMPGFPMRMGPNVMLMWSPVPGATTYNLYRSDKKGEVGPLLVSVPMNNHMDINVPMDKDAAYTVKAVVGGVEGDASSQVVLAGVKPLDPPKFTGDLYGNGQLNLRWDMIKGASFYNVYTSPSKEGPFTLAGSVQEAKYVDASVEAGKTYYYQVSAVDKNSAESPRSEIREVVIPKEVKKEIRKEYAFSGKVSPVGSIAYGGDLGPYKGPGHMVYVPSVKRIYVAGDNDVFSIDLEGNILKRFAAPAGYAGNWGKPLFITADGSTGRVVASFRDSTFGIRVFDLEGALLVEMNLDFPREDYIAEKREDDLKEDERLTTSAMSLAIDGEGDLWVADSVFAQVSVFDDKYERIARLHSPRPRDKTASSTIQGPAAMIYHAPTNRVILLDFYAKRIRTYDAVANGLLKTPEGENFYGWVKTGSGPGYLVIPKGMSVTKWGEIIFVEGASSTIQALNPASPDMDYLYTLVSAPDKQVVEEAMLPFGVVEAEGKVYVSEKLNDRIVIAVPQ